VSYDVDREALLRASLGRVETGALGEGRAVVSRAVREHETSSERRLARAPRALRCGLAPADPAGTREVHDEVQLLLPGVIEPQVEKFAVPRNIYDRAPGESGDRGIEGLECREGDDLEPRDHPTAQTGAEIGREGVNLRQFRHVTSLH